MFSDSWASRTIGYIRVTELFNEMKMKSAGTFSPRLIATLALVISVCTLSLSAAQERKFPNIKIKNFGQMDERFYRGARPKKEDYKALYELGINTVIDLTDNSKEYEQPAVEAHGMRYVNIPMVDKGYPKIDQINEFLKLVDDPSTGKFFVHCAGGRHRTGVVGAVYRFNNDNWTLDQAYSEMKQYDFNSGFGHGKQKDFVKDYWEQFQAKQENATAPITTSR
jgi:protein tyrosine/serine phosphatase